MGVTGNLLKLIHNFLLSRKVLLKINNLIGKERKTFFLGKQVYIFFSLFGLTQGSVLSPMLFIIYVTDMTNDFPQIIKDYLACFKFADDGTLLIAHENILQCHHLMQTLCDHLSKWCIKN